MVDAGWLVNATIATTGEFATTDPGTLLGPVSQGILFTGFVIILRLYYGENSLSGVRF